MHLMWLRPLLDFPRTRQPHQYGFTKPGLLLTVSTRIHPSLQLCSVGILCFFAFSSMASWMVSSISPALVSSSSRIQSSSHGYPCAPARPGSSISFGPISTRRARRASAVSELPARTLVRIIDLTANPGFVRRSFSSYALSSTPPSAAVPAPP